MTAEVKEVKEVRVGVSTFVIGAIVVAIYAVVMTWLAGFNQGYFYPYGAIYEWAEIGFGEYGYPTSGFRWLLMWPWILGVLASLLFLVKRINTPSLVVVFSMLLITLLIPFQHQAFVAIHSIATALPAGDPWKTYALNEANMRYLVPDLARSELWNGYFYGGEAAPWGEWAIPILWFILHGTSLYYMFIFGASLFRRQWIDIERLPYPMTEPMSRALTDATTSDSPQGHITRLLKNKLLWLGTLAGVLLGWMHWLPFFIKGLGKVKYFYDATPLAILPYTPLNFIVEAWAIGLCYFVPLDVIKGYLLGYFVLLFVLPEILVHTGAFDWQPKEFGWGTVMSVINGRDFTPTIWNNFYWSYGVLPNWFFGALIALWVWPLVTVGRANFVASIKAIWKKLPPELEAREPISYRWIWIGFIGCMLATAILMFIGSEGANPIWYGLFFQMVTLFIYGYGIQGRVQGMFMDFALPGGHANILWIDHMPWSQLDTWFIANPGSPLYTEDPATTFRFLHVCNYGVYGACYWTPAFPIGFTMQSYKIASNTNTHSRYILTGAMIAIPISFAISLISNVYFSYLYGILEKWSNSGAMAHAGSWANLVEFMIGHRTYVYQWFPEGGTKPPPPTIHIAIAGGFIIQCLLYILRARFAWWPFHPAGFAGTLLIEPGLLLNIIIALVVKTVLIRIGGMKLYEKGIPFFLGLAASIGLIALVLMFYNALLMLGIVA